MFLNLSISKNREPSFSSTQELWLESGEASGAEGAFGELLPGEATTLTLVFRPLAGEGRREWTLHIDTALGLAAARQGQGRQVRHAAPPHVSEIRTLHRHNL